MGLSRYKVAAGLAVSDMDRAREFYEGKLGLSVAIDSGDNVQYQCAEGSVIHVYLSPEHAGKSTATLAGWGVDDVEEVVDELVSKGVTFERYDEGLIITDEKASLRSRVALRLPTSKTRTATPFRSPRRHIPEPCPAPRQARELPTAFLEKGEPCRERSPQHSVCTKGLGPCASQPGDHFLENCSNVLEDLRRRLPGCTPAATLWRSASGRRSP
jgi:catechol 2,3-dioxygenase-like lactoylglutathione lyase family enzyme